MIRSFLSLVVACGLALPAAATDYVYADFEASVPHIDLPECPERLATEPAICRVTVANDALHVHVFAADGDQRFLGVHSYYEDAFELVLAR
ncbi:MAG: hypothetical protein ACXIU8_02640 [Alkalilacustris sp.]